ncbi:MAG TPA: hypothetical protein VFN30_07645 [Chitinophagaceae bacterium]|nr:hypothetical protein [Chitinophagaceae bacterium]
MNKFFIFLFSLLITVRSISQIPQKMSYQAIVRNSSNQLVTNRTVGMKISILQGSTTGLSVYAETQSPTTNINGLISIEIGSGIVISGNFSTINWANGPYFIKTETDPNGGNNYSISGVSQLLSVPFALYAERAGNGFSGNYNDLSNKPTLFDGQYSSLIGAPALAQVAASGSYSDLINKPTLFDGQYSSLIGAPALAQVAASGSYSDLLNKPTLFDGQYSSLIGAPALAQVATSGSYSDLLNKPALFDGQYSSLIGAPVLAQVATGGSYSDLLNKPTLFDGQYSNLIGAPVLAPVATSGSYSDLSNKPALFDGQYSSLIGAPVLAPVATSGSYSDLSNKPALFDGQYSNLIGAPVLAPVATSGSYSDLSNKPTLFDGQYSSLIGAPVLAPVATSGSYSDLSNKPTLFDGQYSNLIGAPVLAPVATSGSYNDLSNKPTIPPTADGSETKISAGANVSITGTGTSASPYVINASSGSHYLGEDYLGGIVFYLYTGSDGQQHGLVVSKTESSGTWSGNTLVGANRTEDGAYNTNLMPAGSTAKAWVNSLGPGWYLPSIDELNILWQNRFHANMALRAGGYTLLGTTFYWSSTESSNSALASGFYFSAGFTSNDLKGNPYFIRGVRSF